MASIMSLFRQAPEKVFVGDVRLGLVESYVRMLRANPNFLNQCSKKDLSEMRVLAIRSGLKEDHELIKKVDEVSSKLPGKCVGLVAKLPSSKNTSVQDPSVFNQKDLKNNEVLEVLKKRGAEITDLTLTEATDEVMAVLPELCPNLTSLHIQERLDYQLSRGFTDASLVSIGKLPKLKSLNLDLWLNLTISCDAVQTLLSQPNLVANLTDLNISMAARLTDGSMETLATYKKLKNVSFKSSCPLTSSGLETFFKSSSIKATLESVKLDLNNGLGGLTLTDNIAYYLGLIPNLKVVDLKGEWKGTDYYVNGLIAALKQVKVLKLAYPVSLDGLSKLSSTVTELDLGDTSKLASADFDTLLKGRSLTHLSLGKAQNFTDSNMSQVVQLPLVHFGLNGSSIMHGLDTLRESPAMQSGLRSLDISSLPKATNKSLGLSGLNNLTSLRVVDCAEFNDASLKKILDSNLKNTLTKLELALVYISDRYIASLKRLEQLVSLSLGKLPAVTKAGVADLLNTSLAFRLRELDLSDLKMSKTAIDHMINLLSIQSLSVMNGWVTEKKERYFYETLKPLFERNVFIQTGGNA